MEVMIGRTMKLQRQRAHASHWLSFANISVSDDMGDTNVYVMRLTPTVWAGQSWEPDLQTSQSQQKLYSTGLIHGSA